MKKAAAVPLFLFVTLLACDDDDPVRPGAGSGEPASVALSADTLRLTALGAVERLTATVSDASGVALDDAEVVWTSRDTAVATVDSAGRVEAVGTGETGVEASSGGASGTAVARVVQVPATVDVAPASDTIVEGESVALSAAVADANGAGIPDAAVDWTSSAPGLVSVDGDGRATAVGWGEAAVEVTATADDANGSAEIELLGQVAFRTLRDGDYEIWVVNQDGTGATKLTDNEAGDGDPVWSPDGSRIAFTSYRDGNGDIYVMSADGTGLTRLGETTALAEPAWSPDGARVAFLSDRDGDEEIYVVNDDGSEPRRLTHAQDRDYQPVWSPTGGTLAFTALRDGHREIYVMRADGTGTTNLSNTPGYDLSPAWRPRP